MKYCKTIIPYDNLISTLYSMPLKLLVCTRSDVAFSEQSVRRY